jgi:hypothetical protein
MIEISKKTLIYKVTAAPEGIFVLPKTPRDRFIGNNFGSKTFVFSLENE